MFATTYTTTNFFEKIFGYLSRKICSGYMFQIHVHIRVRTCERDIVLRCGSALSPIERQLGCRLASDNSAVDCASVAYQATKTCRSTSDNLLRSNQCRSTSDNTAGNVAQQATGRLSSDNNNVVHQATTIEGTTAVLRWHVAQ